jgi:hypothetical protein
LDKYNKTTHLRKLFVELISENPVTILYFISYEAFECMSVQNIIGSVKYSEVSLKGKFVTF